MPMGEETFRITQIETQKHHSGRVNIYLDGSFAFGLDKETVLRHHLHKGDELTESTIDDILLVEERTKAKEKALALLSYRARSIKELEDKLKDKHFSERTVKRVVDDFSRVGLLDDSKYASSFAQTKMIQKPMGKRLLKQELFSRGISDSIAERTIEEVYSGKDEIEIARELVRRRIRYKKIGDKKIKKRLASFLFRRGFDWNIIENVLQKEMGDISSDET